MPIGYLQNGEGVWGAHGSAEACEAMGVRRDEHSGPGLDLNGIDWLIVGGESGPRHRPMDLAWVRLLRDSTRCSHCDGTGHRPGIGECPPCAGTGAFCAFFFKQLGGAHSGTALEDLPDDLRIREMPARASEETTA